MTRRRRKRHGEEKIEEGADGIIGRLTWMLKVRDCRHICLFCEHYRRCREEGIAGKEEEGR